MKTLTAAVAAICLAGPAFAQDQCARLAELSQQSLILIARIAGEENALKAATEHLDVDALADIQAMNDMHGDGVSDLLNDLAGNASAQINLVAELCR